MRDASTGEVVTAVSTAGLDLAGALEYARTVGQASLGALTFHQRALLLKEFAQILTARKDELYELSSRTGATKNDSMVDIDGGIGVLFTYSSKGRRELPNSQVYVDGPVESLSKDGSFLARHIYTRLPGVAVQINAFNFPVWGSLEKFAPAFLAGVPSLVKPATPTGYLAEAFVRILVESGRLPEGSLQLVSGSVPDLFEHLRLGDLVAFTGSASTAERLRASESVRTGGVRFTNETDSINASVLGEAAVEGTPEFDAFVRGVVTEMTVKAGQKCTSIRRVIVPRGSADAVTAAIQQRIARARRASATRAPRASRWGRWPRSSSATRCCARSPSWWMPAAASWSAAPMRRAVTRADGSVSADDRRARSSRPCCCASTTPRRRAVHEVEAFGPVASLLVYDDLDEAIDLVGQGGGSLVTSIATHDPAEAVALMTGIAPFNGRVLVLDRDDARTSTGHGSPVPHLVHGGPGRAGGGEELGGIRAVLHHMQRTAIQGSPEMLTAITGIWHAGAVSNHEGRHPFRKSLDELTPRRQRRLGQPRGHPGRHRAVRRVHRRHLLRPHG